MSPIAEKVLTSGRSGMFLFGVLYLDNVCPGRNLGGDRLGALSGRHCLC